MNASDQVWCDVDISSDAEPREVARVARVARVPRVEVAYRSRRDFLRAVVVGASECTLSCPREGASPARGPVQLCLRFQSEGAVFELPAEALGPEGGITNPRVRVSGPALQTLAAAVAYAKGNPPAWGRRGGLRMATDLSARMQVGKRAWSGRLRDLSRGGARLSAPGARAAPGEVVELGVRAGLLSRVWLRCRVTWTDPFSADLGLEFVELGAEARRWLLRTLREGQEPQPGQP